MKMLLEVKSVRRCEGGHTCNLVANGRKVAFIAPGIFEWTSFSKKVDVLAWFASREGRIEELRPVRLEQGWESKIPDHKIDEVKNEITEAKLQEWIQLHFLAYEITQKCKSTLMSLSKKGEIFDWRGSAADSSLRAAAKQAGSKILNGLLMPEIVKLVEDGRKNANLRPSQELDDLPGLSQPSSADQDDEMAPPLPSEAGTSLAS